MAEAQGLEGQRPSVPRQARLTRRGFIGGLAAAFAAPAIVRASSLMPVRGIVQDIAPFPDFIVDLPETTDFVELWGDGKLLYRGSVDYSDAAIAITLPELKAWPTHTEFRARIGRHSEAVPCLRIDDEPLFN